MMSLDGVNMSASACFIDGHGHIFCTISDRLVVFSSSHSQPVPFTLKVCIILDMYCTCRVLYMQGTVHAGYCTCRVLYMQGT